MNNKKFQFFKFCIIFILLILNKTSPVQAMEEVWGQEEVSRRFSPYQEEQDTSYLYAQPYRSDSFCQALARGVVIGSMTALIIGGPISFILYLDDSDPQNCIKSLCVTFILGFYLGFSSSNHHMQNQWYNGIQRHSAA